MSQNKLTKIRILSMGLLLSIGYNGVMATDSSDRDALQLARGQVVNAFEALKSGIEEQINTAKELLHSKDIIPEACYTQKNVECAWNGKWAPFAQNVVCVNARKYNEANRQPQFSSGTGTLIDLSIPELQGRVVLTCAHVVLPNPKSNENIEELFSAINGGNEVISIGLQKLRHFKQLIFSSGGGPVEGWFSFNTDSVSLSVEAECQRDEVLPSIPVTDIYLLTGNDRGTNCYDVAICILKESVKYKIKKSLQVKKKFKGKTYLTTNVEYERKIVPGVSLDKLNPFTETERIDATPFFHIHLEGPSGEILPVDKRPVIIGYGLTGLGESVPDCLVSGFSGEQERSFLGLGIKKVMTLNGLDLNGQGVLQNMKGCDCAEHLRRMVGLSLSSLEGGFRFYEECVNNAELCFQTAGNILRKGCKQKAGKGYKLVMEYYGRAKSFLGMARSEENALVRLISKCRGYLEQFRAIKASDAAPLAGSGFSGSLVVGEGDDGRYDAIGVYSGPLFTNGIKDFIEHAVRYHQNCQTASL
jgi:hypothetical protein